MFTFVVVVTALLGLNGLAAAYAYLNYGINEAGQDCAFSAVLTFWGVYVILQNL